MYNPKIITIMSKTSILSVICLLAMFLTTSCGSKKQVVQKSKSPFGEVYSMPCEAHDTKEKYAATGIFRGSSYQKGECHRNAIANAKAIIREKYHSVYKGMISEYSSNAGNNSGNDIATKIERAGDEVVEAVLNDAYEVCSKFSAVDDDGMVECYVAIEIEKGELAAKVAKGVSNVLSDKEKEEINFNEFTYRKQMEERMKNQKAE